MTYKTGSWGIQAKNRSAKRSKYFRERARKLSNYKEGLGLSGEKEIEDRLALGDHLPRKAKFDYFWKNKKIDVKTSIYNERIGRWTFTLDRQRGIVDYFICLCRSERGETKYIFLIPDKDVTMDFLELRPRTINKYFKYLMK